MDGVLCNFKKSLEEHLLNDPKVLFPQRTPGFFKNLEAMEGALASMQSLRNNANYDPYILTAPYLFNTCSFSEKAEWVKTHLGEWWLERLILCGDKSLLRGNILIDDHYSGRGQEGFQGHLMLFCKIRYPDWKSIMEKLK